MASDAVERKRRESYSAACRSRRQSCPALTPKSKFPVQWTIPKLTVAPRRRHSLVDASHFGSRDLYTHHDELATDLQTQIREMEEETNQGCVDTGSVAASVWSSMERLREFITADNKPRGAGGRPSMPRSVSFHKELEQGRPREKLGAIERLLERAIEGPLANFTCHLVMKGIQAGTFCCEMPLHVLEPGDITLKARGHRLIFYTRNQSEFAVPIPRGYLALPDFLDINTLHFKLSKSGAVLIIWCMTKGETSRRRFPETSLQLPATLKPPAKPANSVNAKLKELSFFRRRSMMMPVRVDSFG